jgi:osmoprotectant transport system substrate-binding protein
MNRFPLVTSLAATAALILAGCGGDSDPLDESGDGGDGGSVVVGSANFPENVLLMEIYAQALEAAGLEVETKPNIGSRETYIPGLQDGSIDVLPEYTGNLRLYFDEAADTASDPEGVYQELEGVLPEDLTVLDYSEAQDKDAVVVTSATAEKYDLTEIGDLAPVAGDLTLGGPPEWKTRTTGIPGLKEVYGVTFGDFLELDAGGELTKRALLDERIDAGNIFSTDPIVAAEDLVALEDPDSLFAAQNVVPLVRTESLSDDLESTLNDVSAALDTETLAEMVARIAPPEGDPEDPETVAEEFLADNDLD